MTPVLTFLARRVASTVGVLGVVAVVVFLLLRLVPGDPAAIIAGDSATSEQIEQIREGLGLNRPLTVQFGIWFAQGRPWRPWRVVCLQEDRRRAHRSTSRAHDRPGALYDCPCRGCGRAARCRSRVAPRRLAGPCADGLFHPRLLDPGVRPGLPPHLACVAQAGLAAGAGLPTPLRRLLPVHPAPHPAEHHVVGRLHRPDCAADPGGRVTGAHRGLRPHRQSQGLVRRARPRPACAGERCGADRHGDRHRSGDVDGGRGGDRKRLRHSGSRTAHRQRRAGDETFPPSRASCSCFRSPMS